MYLLFRISLELVNMKKSGRIGIWLATAALGLAFSGIGLGFLGCDEGSCTEDGADCGSFMCPTKTCKDVVIPDVVCQSCDIPAKPDVTPEEAVVEPDINIDELTVKILVDVEILSGIAQITAKVSGGSSIMGVEFYVDEERMDTDLIPPYTASVNTTNFPDGPHFLTVFTADNSGQTASDSLSVTFDNTPPQILATVPAEGDCLFFEDGPLYMEMEVDDVDAIMSAVFRANGLLVGEFAAPPFFANVEFATLFIDLFGLPKNIYLQYEATDYLGQHSETPLNVMVYKRHDWTYETVGEIWGSAVMLPNGNVVFGNNDYKLFCLSPSNGSVVWSYNADQQILKRPAVDPSSGRVFFGTTGGSVYAMNQGGGQDWNQNIGTPPGGDLVFKNNTVYISGYDGHVYALQASNGSTQWQVTLPAYSMSSPGVAGDGRVYVGCQDHKLYSIVNGSIDWSIPTGHEVWSTPAIGPDQTVYFGSNDGWLYAVTYEGQSKWVEEIKGQIWGEPLVSDDGFVYVASTSKYVTKLDAALGNPVWTTKTEGITNSSPVAGPDGTIYIGTTGGTVFALDPDDGHIKWTYTVGNSIHASMVIWEGRLLFGCTDRNFYSLWTDCKELQE